MSKRDFKIMLFACASIGLGMGALIGLAVRFAFRK